MIQLLVICTIMSSANDSIAPIEPAKISYSKQILINSLVSFSCAIGTAVFYRMGNDAYEEYKESETIESALKNWNKAQLYDNVRNVFAIGTVFFLVRSLYYQIKNGKASKSSNYVPVIEIQYVNRPKLIFGIHKGI